MVLLHCVATYGLQSAVVRLQVHICGTILFIKWPVNVGTGYKTAHSEQTVCFEPDPTVVPQNRNTSGVKTVPFTFLLYEDNIVCS